MERGGRCVVVFDRFDWFGSATSTRYRVAATHSVAITVTYPAVSVVPHVVHAASRLLVVNDLQIKPMHGAVQDSDVRIWWFLCPLCHR